MKLRLFILALLISGSSFFSLDSNAAEKVRLLLPQRTVDEALAPFIVAKHLGYYEQEGLNVEMLLVGGSNETAIQIASGNAEIGLASPAQAVIGMQEGAAAPLDIRYFYNAAYQNIWSISVPGDSAIQSIAELRGKRIGVTALGSAGTTYGRAYLRSGGLNPDADVSFIAIGAGSQAIAAIKQKVVEAFVFWDSANARFEMSGLPVRALKIDEKLKRLPDVSLLARNETIRNNPKMLTGFARATAKGLDFSLANPAAAVFITWKLYPESKPNEAGPEKSLAQGLRINQPRMAGWVEPSTNGKRGLFIQQDWESLGEFLLQGQQIAKPVPASRMYTNALIDDVNQYDREAINRQARGFDLNSVR
ncbi:MAG TPA: ABC transporter substrate-binding protein [Pseudolabrys sp.]|nr:ABC transporter substrate-binding protein [Pseudolabrys sp.]